MSNLSPEFAAAQAIFEKLHANLARVMLGQERTLDWLLAALASGSHVLLEDVPGTGKTNLAICRMCTLVSVRLLICNQCGLFSHSFEIVLF